MYKITIEVKGMRCGMCESHINDVVRRTENVKSVKSSRSKNLTEIVVENDIDEDIFKSAIEATGYGVGKITKEPYDKRGIFSFLKK